MKEKKIARKKWQFPPEANEADFQWVDQTPTGLPCLFFGFVQEHDYLRKYIGKGKWEKRLKHIHTQTGGLACNQVYLTGVFVEPTETALKLMIKLNSKYLDSNLGAFHEARLSDILQYEKLIKTFGKALTCNVSFPHFEEAVYPIDDSDEARTILTKEDVLLPDDVREMIANADFIINWSFFVLGEICD